MKIFHTFPFSFFSFLFCVCEFYYLSSIITGKSRGTALTLLHKKYNHTLCFAAVPYIWEGFITHYKYILIVPWTKTSQPSSLYGVPCSCAEVLFPGRQCTHLAPNKNYITMSVQWVLELWGALATWPLHFQQCINCGWQMVSLSTRPWSKGFQTFSVSSFSFLFSFLSLLILKIIFRDHYIQLSHFKDYKIEAQKA